MPFGAGQVVYDDDLATIIAGVTPVETTLTATIATAAAGFAIGDIRACTALNGLLVDLDATVTFGTGAFNPGTSLFNIADTLILTLQPAFRPAHIKSFVWGNGTVFGEGVINPDGTTSCRTLSSGTTNTGNVRFSVCYIRNP